MQLPEGAQWKRVSGTGAGTTVVKDSRTVLYGILIGQNKTGTATVYNTNDAAGTAATNLFSTIDNTSGTSPQFITTIAGMNKGITVVTGGTTDMTFIYQ